MFQLMINEKGGQATSQSFDKNEITIGRVQGNDVVLPKGNISKRHSRIVLKDGKFIIVDLKSTNGTYVNGKKITAPQVIKATDKIYIGDYTLQLTNGGGSAAVSAADSRDASKAAKGREELDLFGGDAGDAPAEPASAGKPGSPGLIDDNFDQEFDIVQEAPQKPAKAATPALGAKSRLPAAKPLEPEPRAEESEAPDLDLAAEFQPQAEPEPEPAPEPEPEPARAPVVPMKPPKKAATQAPQRATLPPSRARPTAGAAGNARGKAAPLDEDRPLEISESEASGTPQAAGGGAASRPLAPVMPIGSPLATPLPAAQSSPVPHGALAGAFPSTPPLDRGEALHALHLALVDELGLRGHDLVALGSMKERVIQTASNIVVRWQSQGRIAQGEDVDHLARTAGARAVDMDLILDLLQDEKVVQIVVTHDRQIWSEREALEPEGRIISSEDQLIGLIQRLGVLGGGDPGPSAPLVDVRLRDGSRVIASLPPLAFRGPTLSIRKATRDAYNLESFVDAGTISEGMMKFIEFCLRTKKNMLLSLGPGVSASATLNAIASQMADDERIVTIESGIELHLGNLKNVTALEPSATTGLAALIHHAVLLQPDRVIIGNVRGPATYDVLSALAGPLDGSLTSYSASSPAEALERLATVDLAGSFGGDVNAARRLVAAAFPIVLQEHRFPEGGSRRITQVTELVFEGEGVALHDIFTFRPEGVDESGVLTGTFAPTGHEPRFVQELVDRGDEIDMEIFKE